MMKFSQLLFVTVSLSVVVLLYLTTSECQIILTEDTEGQNLTLGWRNGHDELLYNETIKVGKSEAISKDIPFPPESDKEKYFITFLKVENHCPGGYVNLTSGGPGYEYLHLHLTSQKGYEFEIRVSIYGHRM